MQVRPSRRFFGVVTKMNPRQGWGTFVYAPERDDHNIIDAISVVLLAPAPDGCESCHRQTVHELCRDGLRTSRNGRTMLIEEVEFHASCVVGGGGENLQPGQLVDVVFNSDNKLLSVLYHQRGG